MGSAFVQVVHGAVLKAWKAFREDRLPLSPRWWARALLLHWRETRSGVHPGPVSFDRGRLNASYSQWLDSRPPVQIDAPPDWVMSVVAMVDDSSCEDRFKASLRSQDFQSWELFIVHSPSLAESAVAGTADERVVSVNLVDQLSDTRSWNPPGSGRWVLLLNADVLLAPHALSNLARAAGRWPDAWIYADDDVLAEDGRRFDPNMKGNFSPELALVDDYAATMAVVPRHTIAELGGLHADAGPAQIYELMLRASLQGVPFRHLAEVCGHARARSSESLTASHRTAAAACLRRRGLPGDLVTEVDAVSGTVMPRVRWESEFDCGDVTVIIPTRDRPDLLSACLSSLERTVDLGRVSLLIVDDRSRPETVESIARCVARLPRCRSIRPENFDGTFNYSRLMNRAADHVDTPFILHLNNDVEAIRSGWLEQMRGWMEDEDIGAVGSRLLFRDGSIQHAGVMVEPRISAPAHLFARLRQPDAGYQHLPHRLRGVAAVTGACLLLRTNLYRELGGFDEVNLPVQFNDIDHCLRLIGIRKRIVYEPASTLIHDASASRGAGYDFQENVYFVAKHQTFEDPFISPHFEPGSLLGATPLFKRPVRAMKTLQG